MKLHFYKYHGFGNDFILIDNREEAFDEKQETIATLCTPVTNVGADGLLTIRKHDGYPFEMRYFNVDGSYGSMCANGARCIIAFAYKLGLIPKNEVFSFITLGKEYQGKYVSNQEISIKLVDIDGVQKVGDDYFIFNDTPHFVRITDNIHDSSFVETAKKIRWSDDIVEGGVNVNYIQKIGDKLHIRTYERHIEDETQACGTGATAAVLAYASQDPECCGESPIKLLGGEGSISFKKNPDGSFTDVWLTGEISSEFKGVVEI